jgi:GT2 family glycosyltransferase
VDLSNRSVSVIIVIWNAKAYVLDCFETLFQYTKNLPLEIIAVDNASTDGTPDEVAVKFPTVKLIRNEKNLGFAKANNIGIHQGKGEYICLVNSDVKFIEDCFSPIIEYMDSHPEIGLLGPQSVDVAGKVIRSTMRFPTVWNSFTRYLGVDLLFPNSRLLGAQLNSDFDHLETKDVEVLNGWFWLVRRSALEKVGLLDEEFFMYGEDLDWCLRFLKAGYRVVFFTGAKAIHYGGVSAAGSPLFFSIEKERATLQLFQKHYGNLSRFAFWLISILGNMVRAIGYGIVWLFKPSAREHALPKYQRSIACLQWLLRGTI